MFKCRVCKNKPDCSCVCWGPHWACPRHTWRSCRARSHFCAGYPQCWRQCGGRYLKRSIRHVMCDQPHTTEAPVPWPWKEIRVSNLQDSTSTGLGLLLSLSHGREVLSYWTIICVFPSYTTQIQWLGSKWLQYVWHLHNLMRFAHFAWKLLRLQNYQTRPLNMKREIMNKKCFKFIFTLHLSL